MCVRRHFVIVAVTSDKEVKGQGQLGVSTFGNPLHRFLIVNLEVAIPTRAGEPHYMPFVECDWVTTPVKQICTNQTPVSCLLIKAYYFEN